MDADVWIPWLVSVMIAVLGTVPGVLAWRGQRRKDQAEASKADAEAASTFQEIANKAAIQALGLQKRIADLEARVSEQDSEIRILRCERDDLKDWAERLVHQVQALGGKPVPFRSTWSDRWNKENLSEGQDDG